jgi:hypothetical protein
MTTASAPEIRNLPAAAGRPGIGHALPVGAAGFAWCSLALGLSTVGVLSTAGGSIILAGTFFYGGIDLPLASPGQFTASPVDWGPSS